MIVSYSLFLTQLGLIPTSLAEQRRVVHMQGQFVNGKLNGIVNIVLVDSSSIEGFAVDNVFHGIVRRFVKSSWKNGRRKRYNSEALNQKAKKDQNSLTGTGDNRTMFSFWPSTYCPEMNVNQKNW